MMIRQSPYRTQAELFATFFDDSEARDASPCVTEGVFDVGEDRAADDAEAFVVRAVPGESAVDPPARPLDIVLWCLAMGVVLLSTGFMVLMFLR